MAHCRAFNRGDVLAFHADVGLHGFGLAAGSDNLRNDRVERLLATAANDDRRAFFSKPDRCGGTDAAATAGHKCHFTLHA